MCTCIPAPALRFMTQPVKDLLIWREENGFVQRVILLQGLHGALQEQWYQVGEIFRNFEIKKKEPDAVILAQALDKLGEREDRDALPCVLITIVPHHLMQRHLMDGLGQQWTEQTTHPGGTYLTFDAWPPVMPQHQLLVAGHAYVEFQGISPQLQGCLEALKGIFARLIRGTSMPDNQEIASWRLLSHWESSLTTRQCYRYPESESDTHAHLFPGIRRPHCHLCIFTSQVFVYGTSPLLSQ
jgi:hypothetical protein